MFLDCHSSWLTHISIVWSRPDHCGMAWLLYRSRRHHLVTRYAICSLQPLLPSNICPENIFIYSAICLEPNAWLNPTWWFDKHSLNDNIHCLLLQSTNLAASLLSTVEHCRHFCICVLPRNEPCLYMRLMVGSLSHTEGILQTSLHPWCLQNIKILLLLWLLQCKEIKIPKKFKLRPCLNITVFDVVLMLNSLSQNPIDSTSLYTYTDKTDRHTSVHSSVTYAFHMHD